MLTGFFRRFLERRRFPGLLMIAAGLLLVNLFVPDPLPFIDEALMVIATLLLGAWRDRRGKQSEPEQETAGDTQDKSRTGDRQGNSD